MKSLPRMDPVTSSIRRTDQRIHHRSTTQHQYRSREISNQDEAHFIQTGRGNLVGITQRYPYNGPEQDIYNKAEIDELVVEIYRVIKTSDDYHSKRLDDVYYPFDNRISLLTTRTYEMMQNLAMLQKQHVFGARRSKSIDAHTQTSIDASIQSLIDAQFTSFEDRLQSFTYRLDGVCYPLRDSVDELISRLDALLQEMDTIQSQLDSQAEPSPSIDRRTRPSIDRRTRPSIDGSTTKQAGYRAVPTG